MSDVTREEASCFRFLFCSDRWRKNAVASHNTETTTRGVMGELYLTRASVNIDVKANRPAPSPKAATKICWPVNSAHRNTQKNANRARALKNRVHSCMKPIPL